MLVPTSTGRPTSETRGRLRGGGGKRTYCMDFIYRTDFEGVKILFLQL